METPIQNNTIMTMDHMPGIDNTNICNDQEQIISDIPISFEKIMEADKIIIDDDGNTSLTEEEKDKCDDNKSEEYDNSPHLKFEEEIIHYNLFTSPSLETNCMDIETSNEIVELDERNDFHDNYENKQSSHIIVNADPDDNSNSQSARNASPNKLSKNEKNIVEFDKIDHEKLDLASNEEILQLVEKQITESDNYEQNEDKNYAKEQYVQNENNNEEKKYDHTEVLNVIDSQKSLESDTFESSVPEFKNPDGKNQTQSEIYHTEYSLPEREVFSQNIQENPPETAKNTDYLPKIVQNIEKPEEIKLKLALDNRDIRLNEDLSAQNKHIIYDSNFKTTDNSQNDHEQKGEYDAEENYGKVAYSKNQNIQENLFGREVAFAANEQYANISDNIHLISKEYIEEKLSQSLPKDIDVTFRIEENFSSNNSRSFSVKMEPEVLGKVQVDVVMNHNGTADIRVSSVELSTIKTLYEDANSLQEILKNNEIEINNIEFCLDSGGNSKEHNSNNFSDGNFRFLNQENMVSDNVELSHYSAAKTNIDGNVISENKVDITV